MCTKPFSDRFQFSERFKKVTVETGEERGREREERGMEREERGTERDGERGEREGEREGGRDIWLLLAQIRNLSKNEKK